MTPSGRLGSKTSVSCGGKFIGEFDNDDDAVLAIGDWQEKHNIWPTVWSMSDHGNAHLYSDFAADYKKLKNTKQEMAPSYEPKGTLSKDETQLINKIRYSPEEKLVITKKEKHLFPLIISLCKKGFCNWGIDDRGNAEVVLTY